MTYFKAIRNKYAARKSNTREIVLPDLDITAPVGPQNQLPPYPAYESNVVDIDLLTEMISWHIESIVRCKDLSLPIELYVAL